MRALILAALCLPLLGCETTEYEPTKDSVFFQVKIVEEIEYKDSYHALALTKCSNNVCVIEIRRYQYPNCLVHEIRHVFEGDWHKGRETTEDCFQEAKWHNLLSLKI